MFRIAAVGRRPGSHFLLRLVATLILVALPHPVSPQASPYVPTLDSAYRDLDDLIRVGLVKGMILGQRPYSRMAFARATRQGRETLYASPHGVGRRFVESLERLELRFARELAENCTTEGVACFGIPLGGTVRSVSLEASVANSPLRPIVARYGSGPLIDADIAPLLQRNRGRVLADGWTTAGEALVDLGLGTHLAAQFQPRFSVAEGEDGEARGEMTLQEGYLRGLLGNLSLAVGRTHVTHGHSRDLAPVLSSNPRSLDMVRLSMEDPGVLPWVLRYLGPTSWSLMVADMGVDRDTPHSKFVLVEGAIRPQANLELGLTLVSHQGGEGSPEASWGARIRDVFPILLSRRPFYWGEGGSAEEFSDKMVGMDARLTLPAQGLDLYLEMATTDDHDFFQLPREALWMEAVWTGGVRLSGLGEEGRFDLWAEANHAGVRPYTHHQFTSGITVDRRVLGSSLGPTAAAFQGGVEWFHGVHSLALSGAWERYEGDFYANTGGGDNVGPNRWKWERIEDRPDEIRKRVTMDWTLDPGAGGFRSSLRLGYEHVTRFNFTDINRDNFLAQLRVDYLW